MRDEIEILKAACFELARSTKWAQRPIDTADIQQLADRLYEVAKAKVEITSPLGVDIPMVARAVNYLHQAHAIPPMGEDTQWFSNMLDALIEVACPNSGLEGEGRAFLQDMLHGIGQFIDKER